MRPATGAPRAALLAVAAWAIVQTAVAAWHQDWTYDERFHLDWARRLVDTRVTERQSLERFNSKTPITVGNVMAERAAAAAGIEGPRGARFAARLPGAIWLAALIGATFGLAASAFGPRTALVAAGLLALDPNVIAHASVVSVDVPYALATVLTAWAALLFAREPSLRHAAALGGAFGLALLTKFTALLLLPVLLLPLILAVGERPRRTRATFGGLAAACGIAWAMVAVGYLFSGFGQRLGDVGLHSNVLSRLAAAMPGFVVLLPADFLTGIDRSLASERAGWNVILFGRLHPGGTPVYFPALWALKTPLLIAAAQVVGLALAVRQGLLRSRPALYVLVALVIHVLYFSLLFKAQIGYRFVLMAVPLVNVLAAAGLGSLGARPSVRWAAIATAAVALLEGAFYVGNPLSFTNAAVWPKRNAYRLLADSNLDWGQNREKIAGWLQGLAIPANRLDPPHIASGTNVVGVNNVAGVWDFERYRWLREHAEPYGHLGHTYLLFEITEDLYERFLTEARTFPPSALANAYCPDEGEHLPPGVKQPFKFDGLADATRLWIVCVTTVRGADVGLRGFTGGVGVGHADTNTAPPMESVLPDQVLWYRLQPGAHVFVARQLPNRRTWIPAAFDGEWHVRRRGARISVREIRAE